MPCSGKLLIEAIRQHCLLDQALVNRLLKQLEQKQKKKQTSQSAAAGNSAADWRDPPILRFRKWGFQGVGSSAQTSIFIKENTNLIPDLIPARPKSEYEAP